MYDFPAENQVGGDDQALPATETDKDEDDGDLCRICRSPEGPNNPLRYPCACRGSIKFVHQECLLLWLNRRGYKQCEVCKRSYSFVPVYSENAPEKLPWHEFMRGLLLRGLRLVGWVFVFLFNAYCFPLHPWGREAAIEYQRDFRVSEKFAFYLAGFVYNGFIAYVMTMVVFLMLIVEGLSILLRGILVENHLGHGVVAGIALVLWKQMRILCDWFHDTLVTPRLFNAIMGIQPREVVAPRRRHAQLHEFGAIRRFFYLLDDNQFAVLAISFYVTFFFILLPFFMGKLVFGLLLLFPCMEVAMQHLSGDSFGQEPVVVEYMIMASLSFAYLGSFVTLRLDSIQAIAKRLLQGFLIITAAIPYLLWTVSVKVWKNLYVVKDSFVLCLKFGVFPLVLGCWLDFCTLPILGTRVSQRLEILSDCPYLMSMHWVFGIVYLMCAFVSMELIQKIIQKRPIWGLLDVTDPNYKITKLHLGQILFALAFHGSFMVVVVHLPIKSISLISPSFFPLQLWIYEERIVFFSIAAYLFLLRVGAPQWLIDHIIPPIKPIVHKWIITVSSLLQLSEFLLENHSDQNVRPLLQIHDPDWFLLFSIAEGSVVSFYGSQSASETTFEEDIDHDRFIPRIGLMLVLAALSLFLISTGSMALPILVGRAFFHSISFIMLYFGLKHDDLYGFWIGCYILRAIYIKTCFIYYHIMIGRTDLLLNLVMLWIRNALLFSIWITVIPTLLGLLIDLMIIIPSRVPLNESPVYSLLQDWLIGLVFLHIWTYMTMFKRINWLATVVFREKFERIRNVGINQLPSTWLLRDVIGSIINTLLTTLGFPFLVAYSLFPLFGFSEAVNLAVQRLIWPVVLAIIIIGFIAKLTLNFFVYIHRVIYDDRYLVGDRVTDFTEDLKQGINSAGL
ncbi:hypothetical protein AALP_AA7G191100 [Arabis alpina]|uniref:RING-CH-type domain-containing protein n=1 Tax=Arabis alpina TaxID=50452 RepID=A0A087GJ28_ARAAL|nr:hypothetical protein AALP_AA7G191100 [Arabis alpina]